MILYRPMGPVELQLVQASGWTRFPPRLPEQPIFYPVLTLEYAREVHRWNEGGAIVRWEMDPWVERYSVQIVGSREHQELWVPADELDEFNQHIVGLIKVVEVSRTIDR